jgi:hypothetical protein
MMRVEGDVRVECTSLMTGPKFDNIHGKWQAEMARAGLVGVGLASQRAMNMVTVTVTREPQPE